MTTYRNCIKNAVDQGALTLEEGQRLEKKLDAIAKAIPDSKEAKARMVAALDAEAQEKERRALLMEEVRKARVADIMNYRSREGFQTPWRALQYIVQHNGQARVMDLKTQRDAIMSRWQGMMEEYLHEMRKGGVTGDLRRKLNTSVVELQTNIVKELFGEKSGDPTAARLAQAVASVMEDARTQFNAAGGNIAKLDKWGMPQWHNSEAVFKFGREKWVDYMMSDGVLDRARMIDHDTGARLTDAEIRDILPKTWEKISSDGWSDKEPMMASVGKGALYKQHQDHRFIHFANADAWLKYAKDFGAPDPYVAIQGHLSTMARDVAAMKVLGPNPALMWSYLKDVVKSHSAKAPVDRMLRAEQMAEIKRLTEAIYKDTPNEKVRTEVDRLKADFEQKMADLHAKRETAAHSSEWTSELDAAHAAWVELQKWTEARTPDAATTERIAEHLGEAAPMELNTPEKIAAFERVNEIFDDLREEQLIPEGHKWRDKVDPEIKLAESMWDLYRGTANAPVNSQVARTFRGIRNFLTAAKLQQSVISSTTDMGFQKTQRAFLGMEKSSFGSILSGYVKMLSQQNRREMVRSGLILDGVAHGLHEEARYAGGIRTSEWMGYMADRTLSLSGMTPFTQYGKWAFGMELFGHFNDMKEKAWADLPSSVRNTLDRHSITSGEWDQIRAAPSYSIDARSAGILRPNEVEAVAGRKLADKYAAIYFRELPFAVPEPTLRVQAMMTQGSKPGTLIGEALRSATQFKSFSITVMMLQAERAAMLAAEGGGWKNLSGGWLGYTASMLLWTTMLGAAVLQVKELLAGRDPRPMGNVSFWGASLLQGGGIGIMGDFLNSTENRFGGGLAGTLAGPLAGELDRAMQYTWGNVVQGWNDKNTNIGRETSDLIRRNTPFLGMPGIRLFADHLLFDRVQRMLDPDVDKAFKRRIDVRQKEYGNGYWFEPGETRASRAPDLSVAVTRKQ